MVTRMSGSILVLQNERPAPARKPGLHLRLRPVLRVLQKRERRDRPRAEVRLFATLARVVAEGDDVLRLRPVVDALTFDVMARLDGEPARGGCRRR